MFSFESSGFARVSPAFQLRGLGSKKRGIYRTGAAWDSRKRGIYRTGAAWGSRKRGNYCMGAAWGSRKRGIYCTGATCMDARKRQYLLQ